jgi:hypothetical protein
MRLSLPAALAALALLASPALGAFDSCPDTAVVRIVAVRGIEARALRIDDQVLPFMMPAMGSGTGLVVTADGVILTARHVVENAHAIAVFVPGGEEPLPARLIHIERSAEARDDFAFIKVAAEFDEQTQVIGLPTGQVSAAAGERISARGHPGGEKAETRHGEVRTPLAAEGTLELDVDLEPGFSGGPICREAGLLGIGVQSDACGLGVAVPVQRIADRYREHVLANGLVDKTAARMQGPRWRSQEIFSRTIALYAVELAGWSLILFDHNQNDRQRLLAIGSTLEEAADLPEVQLIYAMIYWNWAMIGHRNRGCRADEMDCWREDEQQMLKSALELLDGAVARDPGLLDAGGELLRAIMRTCDATTTFCSGS